MAPSSIPLTALTEAQRTQAQQRFPIIRPALEDGITQAQVARTHTIPAPTIRRWMMHYRDKGLAGLADGETRSDQGKSRRFPPEALALIEGLALQSPQRSMAAIHRQVSTLAAEQGWQPLSSDRVRQIIKNLDPRLVTMAHQGTAASREEFDLLSRREAKSANAMWQADHSPLDIVLLTDEGKPAKPWLTVIQDDSSRAIASFRLTFQKPTALTTALTLRQAIWRKEDPHWQISGIASVFSTDHGSDFPSHQMEQVAIDLGIEFIFSEKGVPRGRGKIERFLRSVNELLLQDLPGYSAPGYKGAQAQLTLPAFEQQLRTWLLNNSHHRVHSETKCTPASRWEKGGFVPRMPQSLEQLDLLLFTGKKTCRVQQDGIRFEGYRSIDPTLAGSTRQEVVIRYDPADRAEIRVFSQDHFLCRATSPELAGATVSLKEIEKARTERRKPVRRGLCTRAAVVEHFLAVHQEEVSPSQPQEKQREPEQRPKLKGSINE